MLIQPELEVVDTLTWALQAIRDDPDVLTEIFGSRPPEEQEEILTFLGQREVPVRLAFPRDPTELPGYYVNLGLSRESNQPIGMYVGDEKVSDERYEEFSGVFFDGSVRVICVASDNTAIPVWLGEIARWACLRYREALQKRGLLEQMVQITDFEPMPTWFPTLVFRRDVILGFKALATVLQVYPALRELDVTGEADSGDRGTYQVTLKGK